MTRLLLRQDLTAAEFAARFEVPRVPVVVTGLTDAWPAQQQWTPAALLRRFGEHRFKVGSDDDGYPVRLRFDHFLRYAAAYPHHAASDDSPLYVFDGTFGERGGSASMLHDYSVPHLWPEDVFAMAGERRRPPYRCVRVRVRVQSDQPCAWVRVVGVCSSCELVAHTHTCLACLAACLGS